MTIRELEDIIEQGEALKLISTAYTEIATAKLKKIRGMVLQNRDFLADLSSVFLAVKQVAIQRKIKSALQHKPKGIISILITSNYHFYGNVNSNLIKFFISSVIPPNGGIHTNSDLIIIGQTAIKHLKDTHFPKPFQEVTLKKDYPDLSELNLIVEKTKEYNQVLVFFAKMKTVMVQDPTIVDITQSSYLKPPTQEQMKSKEPLFIFEPEIEKVLLFFEAQVKNLLLQQTFLESELSRTASRLVSMDQAQTNADDFIMTNKILLDLAKRSIQNQRIIETWSGMTRNNSEYQIDQKI